jgi:hypothetical protein
MPTSPYPTVTPADHTHSAGAYPSASRFSVFADGAPGGWDMPNVVPGRTTPWEADPEPAPESLVGRATRAATRVRTYEGLRGTSTRLSVALRQVGAFFLLAGCVGVAHWSFSVRPDWRFGGALMLFSVAFILAVAAVGTVLYAESRQQIIDQARHFAFGIVLMPGAAIAVFMRITSSALGPTAGGDMFASVLTGNGIALVYLSIVAIPAFVFAKYVFGGLRSVNRRALADEETVAAYMRQDGLQR